MKGSLAEAPKDIYTAVILEICHLSGFCCTADSFLMRLRMLLVFQPWGYILVGAGGCMCGGRMSGFTTSGELVTSLGA